jgi:hypothetical protein
MYGVIVDCAYIPFTITVSGAYEVVDPQITIVRLALISHVVDLILEHLFFSPQ